MSNLKRFNHLTAKLFAVLYRNFPLESKINLEQFGREVLHAVGDGAAADSAALTRATLEWLDRAGYIWLTPPEFSTGDYAAVLSPKGLESLQILPESLTYRAVKG